MNNATVKWNPPAGVTFTKHALPMGTQPAFGYEDRSAGGQISVPAVPVADRSSQVTPTKSPT